MMEFEIKRKSFLASPPFWKTRVTEIQEVVVGFRGLEHIIVGNSAGKRPIHSLSFGKKEEARSTATLSSAIASGHPEAFLDTTSRAKPVLMIISAVHGQEMEGTAVAMNLLTLLDRGVDLRGRSWQQLREHAEGFRIVVVPLANPDGRERIPINNLLGAEVDEVYYYGQGVTKDGELLRWPEVKRWQPVPLDMVELLGAYYNDRGVNIEHDDFVVSPGPETRSLLELAKEEKPDVVVVFHGCGNAPTLLGPDRYLPEPYQARQAHLESVILWRLQREGFAPVPPRVEAVRGFGLHLALFMVSGCVPLCFELPHGLSMKPFTFDDIIDIGLIGLEELMAFGRGFNLRPRSIK